MALCPACHTEQTRRVNGRCPNCKAKVEIHDGYWYPAGTGSPNTALLELFEGLVSDRQTVLQNKTIVFRIPKKSAGYRRELVAAGRLMEMAEYDIDTAKEALKLLFTDKQFSWKTYNTLRWIGNEYLIALGLVRAKRDEATKVRVEEDAYVQRLLEEDDIFS